MRIKRISIENFRSFGAPAINIDISQDTNYYVLAGANASGKTNLLEAIRWATLNKSIGGDFIEPWDFYNGNTENAIGIEVEIDPPLKQGDTFNRFADVAIFKLEAKEYKVREEKGSIRCDHPALTIEKKQVLTNQATPVAKGRTLSQEEKDAKQNARPLLVRDIKDRIPIYYLDNASYSYHLTMGRGSLLLRLARILHDDLMRDDNRITWRGKEQTRGEVISQLLDELSGIFRTSRTDELLGIMTDFMAAQMQIPRESLNLRIGLPQGQELLKKMELLGKDHGAMPDIPFERLGRGYSALGIVALFRALNRLDDEHQGSIVLIEEPEIFLGPHLRSMFAETLQAFAKNGNQVIVVTHSAEFFDPYSPKSAIIVKKENNKTILAQWPIGAAGPSFDISLKHVEPNLNKIIFSKKILFIEGPDDYAAVNSAFELLKIKPAYLGLEILRLSGYGNIKHLAPYAKNLGITFASLLDATAKPILESIDSTGSTWALFDPDLEGALNTSKHDDNSAHIYNLIASCKDWPTLKGNYPKFAVSYEKILSILGIKI
ncbi:MAG: AAA family ATPase [Candidatus Margulisiibacteriota bacterium]